MRFWFLVVAVLVAGCATPPMYSWGRYDSMLYASYKDPASLAEFRAGLETLIAETEERRQKVPPGIYAELGTLYLQSGDTDKAISLYTKEKAAWPESSGMMNALIANLERRKVGAEGGGK